MERRIPADPGDRANGRTGVEQNLRDPELVVQGGPMQCREPIRLRRVGILTLLKQRANRFKVRSLRRVGDG
ncbi:MAG: hypothetical protein V3T24_14435 [Longimicrobiales bacterium]